MWCFLTKYQIRTIKNANCKKEINETFVMNKRDKWGAYVIFVRDYDYYNSISGTFLISQNFIIKIAMVFCTQHFGIYNY
jgi:hypothetical protein